MMYILIGLLSLSILLLFISIFMKDPYKELRNELDQLSMQQIQDLYQIKRKLKILEEELLIDESGFRNTDSFETHPNTKDIHAIIKNQVWSLAQQGLSIEQISSQSSLTPDKVTAIIYEFSQEGNHYE